jgi:hypothetical protein
VGFWGDLDSWDLVTWNKVIVSQKFITMALGFEKKLKKTSVNVDSHLLRFVACSE